MTMHIEFEATLDDLAECQLRAWIRRGTFTRSRWVLSLGFGVIIPALALFVVSIILPREGSPPVRVIAAVVAGLFVTGYTFFRFRSLMRRSVKKQLRRSTGGSDGFLFAVEPREDCLWAKRGTTQLSFDWGNVEEVVDGDQAVEVWMRDGGAVHVLRRGFKDIAERELFIRTVRQKAGFTPGG